MRLAQKGDEAVMEVIDSGPGISAAERERVFDVFYRIPGSPGDGRDWGPPWHGQPCRVLRGRGGCVQVRKAIALIDLAVTKKGQGHHLGILSKDRTVLLHRMP